MIWERLILAFLNLKRNLCHSLPSLTAKNLFREEGKKIIATALTRADIVELSELIDVKLSPENISWDGERSPAEIRKASQPLLKALRELKAESAKATARELYASFNDGEKLLVRLGMFPAEKMKPIAKLGRYESHAVTCALMDLGGTP